MARQRPKRTWLRRVLAMFFLLVVGCLFLAGWVYWKVTSRPSWWESVKAPDPVVATQRARDVESRVTTELSQVRPPVPTPPPAPTGEPTPPPPPPDGRFKVALEDDEATAWLEDRLQAWISNRDSSWHWPERFSTPRVQFIEGRVKLGVETKTTGGEAGKVVWAEVSPRVDEQGRLWLKAERIGIGRLGMGAATALTAGSAVMDQVTGGAGGSGGAEGSGGGDIGGSEEMRKVVRVLSGEEAAVEKPIVSLGDGRLLRLVGLTLRDGRLEAELEPVRR